MAQPPATVVGRSKPVGPLRLYHLLELTSFRCVCCWNNKTARKVATLDGDWTQTVCNHCYVILAQKQRGEAKGVAKGKPLHRRLPGIDGLLEFFRAAGVDVALMPGNFLRINGRYTQPLTHLPLPWTGEWNSIVDGIALRDVGGKFIKAVQDNLRFSDDLRISPKRSDNGFVIMRGGVRLGIIRATHARIRHRKAIEANFLTPGHHWKQLADVLQGAEPELVADWERKQQAKAGSQAAAEATGAKIRRIALRRIDQLPDDLAPELISACNNASRRIRLERQVAYERPVILECDVGELTLLPIGGTGTRLLMPFCLAKGTMTLKGELILSDRDPLPLLIDEGITDEDTILAWTSALLGFADATCTEFEPVEPPLRKPTGSRQRGPSSASHRSSTQTLPRTRRWPRQLEPVGHWMPYSGSFVAGHRRRLPDGRTASTEARYWARQVGIILHSHETWVRPHARGVPDGVEMRFRWHAPTELKLIPLPSSQMPWNVAACPWEDLD